MNRLWYAVVLGALGMGVTGPDRAPREKALFEEPFIDRLKDGWSWLREEPRAWRIDKGALELRTSPGYLHGGYNNARNVLLRPLPRSEHPLAIEAHVEGEPKVQFEHAGIVWYVDDDNYVSLFQEVLGGRVVLQMVTEKDGKPRTAVARHDARGVWLRLSISAGRITGQYRSSEEEPWRDVGQGAIPAEGPTRVGILAGGAPKQAERHVRFRAFRILEILND